MKSFFSVTVIIVGVCILAIKSSAQNYNFQNTPYYLSPDSSTAPGTQLTPSGATLNSFNYNGTIGTEPIFTSGIYFPVVDCNGKNLWIRFQNIAADPNGTTNGYNVPQTTNSICLGPDMIGGFSGFLYDIKIFIDQSPTGTPSYILDTLYPSNIKVESLETLYNNGTDSEWLSFIIKNSGSTGWNLNSINFTGSNVNSNPGFSSVPVYTGTGNPLPPGFTSSFPTGHDSIYAISLSLAPNYSEFMMSAGNVYHFTYGYELLSWGYQGMGMVFGGAPSVTDSAINASCNGNTDGSINLQIDGSGPFNFEWNTGDTVQNILNLGAGIYSVTVTDIGGCSVTHSASITEPSDINLALNIVSSDSAQVVLEASTNGNYSPYSYSWSNGEITDTIIVTSNGIFSVTVTDSLGCSFTDTINVTSFPTIAEEIKENDLITLFPSPATDYLTIASKNQSVKKFIILDGFGRVISFGKLTKSENELDIHNLASGVYLIKIETNTASCYYRFLKI